MCFGVEEGFQASSDLKEEVRGRSFLLKIGFGPEEFDSVVMDPFPCIFFVDIRYGVVQAIG